MTNQTCVSVNGRHYAWPKQPVVIVCIDGSEPDYIEQAVAGGHMPWMQKNLDSGASDLRGHCVVPSFTNPNNISIVTGVEPSVHGICGNFYYDRENDVEVMMNEPSLLRTPTIFKAFQDSGASVAVITAKDKLRRLLGNELTMSPEKAVCFSSEKSDKATLLDNGIENINQMIDMDVPSVYSAELSEFIFKAGVKLMETMRPDLMYLSTTDYIQHKFAPGSDGANRFYNMMDSYWKRLDEMGAVIGLTADHGMNAKHSADGKPQVIYLQDHVDTLLGKQKGRVILPITDPYVVHHGALGSYATVYLEEGVDQEKLQTKLSAIPGMQVVYTNQQGCAEFGLASDRMGDLILVSDTNTVLGTSEDRHDLSGLEVPLRSHGGISEQVVPLVFNRKVTPPTDKTLRNFDIFELALNHTSN